MANGNTDASSVIVELQQPTLEATSSRQHNNNDYFGNVTSFDISLTCPLYVGFISPSMKLNEMIEDPPNTSEGEISAARKKWGQNGCLKEM